MINVNKYRFSIINTGKLVQLNAELNMVRQELEDINQEFYESNLEFSGFRYRTEEASEKFNDVLNETIKESNSVKTELKDLQEKMKCVKILTKEALTQKVKKQYIERILEILNN